MRAKSFYKSLAVITAGIAAITTVTCDPYNGTIDLFRDDDRNDFFFDDYFVDDIYIDDCFFLECF